MGSLEAQAKLDPGAGTRCTHGAQSGRAKLYRCADRRGVFVVRRGSGPDNTVRTHGDVTRPLGFLSFNALPLALRRTRPGRRSSRGADYVFIRSPLTVVAEQPQVSASLRQAA